MWVLIFLNGDISSDMVFSFTRMHLFNNFLMLVSLSMLVPLFFRVVAPLMVALYLCILHAGLFLATLSIIILFESFVDISNPKVGC